MNKYNLTKKEIEDILDTLFNSNDYKDMKDAIYKERLADYELANEYLKKELNCQWASNVAKIERLNVSPIDVLKGLLVAVKRYREYRDTECFTIENSSKYGIDYSVPARVCPTREEFKEIVDTTVSALESLSYQIEGYSYEDNTERFVKEDLEEAIKIRKENKPNYYGSQCEDK